jgi:dimethylargininase
MVESVERLWGGHSMVAPLRRVLVYPPVPPEASVSWEAFGYLRPVDHELAREEHAVLRQMLTDAGIEVITGEIDSGALQDAIFPYDPSYITDRGAIIFRPGKGLRSAEAVLHEATMADIGIPVIGRIEHPGTVEGGDCLWIDRTTLAVGRGYRTNQSGIDQLTALMGSQGVDVPAFDLPHWNGPGECLHLLSLISMLDDDLAVVHKPLMATALVQLLEARGVEMVEIPEDEFVSQGTNVLVTAPRQRILLRENTGTAERLRAAGCTVTLLKGDEISHNRTGGPTCLTRPILRSVG